VTLSLGTDRHAGERSVVGASCLATCPDAEVAAEYLVSRVAARAGVRLRQGARLPSLSARSLGEHLDVVAKTRLRGVSQPVAEALVAWGEGRRRVHLLSRVPEPRELLLWQSNGERCVSLLPDGAETAPHEGGLAFLMHDLCHLEKFVDPAHHEGQVGFFATVHAATERAPWSAFLARFDGVFRSELDHVVADMNGSAVFLFAALKMKLKMAVRRRLARARGCEATGDRVSGALDAEEQAAFAAELEALFDLLELRGPARDAARRVSTRRDDRDAAIEVLAHFEAIGSRRLAVR
jgi:hypothetical protein